MAYFARPNHDGSCFQPLSDHILQTAKLASSAAESISLGIVALLCGLLHDLGKYAEEFQLYIQEIAVAIKENRPLPTARFDHGVFGAMYVYEFINGLLASSSGSTCLIKGKEVSKTVVTQSRDLLAMCICYHHGSLQDYIPVSRNEEPALLVRLNKMSASLQGEARDSWEQALDRFFKEICSEEQLHEYIYLAILELDDFNVKLFDQAFLSKLSDNAQANSQGYLLSMRAYAWQMLVRYIYSVLIDADRWDAYLYQTNSSEAYNHDIDQHLDSYILNLDEKLEAYSSEKAVSPSAAKIQAKRQEVSDYCAEAARRHTGLYDLTVPTGGGKTLASLRFALEHIKFLLGTREAKQRIIYVLPYTTIIEQNAADVREALQAPFEEVLEVHSQVTFQSTDSIFSADQADKNTLTDERNYKLLSERYNSPIIFMTQVAFLNTLLKANGQNARRLSHLANSVIILDEAQTLPLHSTYFCNASLNCLVHCFNSTVVMCTATQPPLESLAIPLLYSEDKYLIPPSSSQLYEDFKRVEIQDATKKAGHSIEKGAAWLMSKFKNARSVLIVLNTKKGVKRLAELLEDHQKDFEIIYLTTYLCAAHRKEKMAAIRKKMASGTRLMVVSTNLIECGVNLSFEFVVRNMAGLPSIIQSCGRANRNAEQAIGYGYLVDWDENIQKIGTLPEQQASTRSTLRSLLKNPDSRPVDLLSPELMDMYYKRYFVGSITREMSYPLMRNDTLLYEYLDSSQIDVLEFSQKWPFALKTAFRFVSENYEVIANGASTLLVPYKDGRSLQADLLNAQNLSIAERASLLQKIQPYTVNMYLKHRPKKDDESYYGRLFWEGLCKVAGLKDFYIVKDGFYNENYGASATGLFDDNTYF